MGVEDRIHELGLVLPAPSLPVGNYVRTVRIGNLLYVSGTGSVGEQMSFKGKLGRELSTEEGYQAARLCALNILSTLKTELEDLDKVVRMVRLAGLVNSTQEFTDHSVVMNGASDLFVQVFGERGKHARSVGGVAALPSSIAVEVDALVEVA